MTEVSSLVLIVLGELLFVTTVLSVLLAFFIFSKKSKDQSAAKTLIGRIKDDEQRRLAETRKIMEGQYGFSGDDLKEIVAKINREEKLFYQNVINIYLRRDHESLQNLNVDFEGAVDTYRTLEIPDRGSAEEEAVADGGIDGEEVESLKAEIEALKQELQITMDTMGNMLSEYAAIFSNDPEAASDPERMAAILGGNASEGEAETGAVATAQESPAAVSDEAPSEEIQEVADEDLMSLDDDDLMSLDDTDQERDAAGDLDHEVVAVEQQPEPQGESTIEKAVDVEADTDDDLMSLDDDDLMSLDAMDELDAGEADAEVPPSPAVVELQEEDALVPDETAASAVDEKDLDLTALEDLEDDLDDIPETVDLDTEPATDDETVVLARESGSDEVDDPDALLDQIRAADEKKES